MFQNSPGGKSEELWTCYQEVVCLSWLCPYLGVHNLGRHIPEFCCLQNRKDMIANCDRHPLLPSHRVVLKKGKKNI